MKHFIFAAAAVAALGHPAFADGHKIGILMGYTGPIESLTPGIAAGAEIAIAEVNAAGGVNGTILETVQADTTCVDAAAATAAAERLVNAEGVVGIVGALCSGATTAAANNVVIPAGVTMISPASTSPAVTGLDDDDLVFRTAPSDEMQGSVLAHLLIEKGITEVALTYTNNDYGGIFADSFAFFYEEMLGGEIVIFAGHEDGRADYSAEVAALSASGADHLVVIGYVDAGGRAILQQAIETDAFMSYSAGDGMYGDSLIEALGEGVEGIIVTRPGNISEGMEIFTEIAAANNLMLNGPYQAEAYDAAAVLALALAVGGDDLPAAVRSVANAPGEPIRTGELAKALEIIANGGDIDYVGATEVEFDVYGDPQGSYLEMTVENGSWVTKRAVPKSLYMQEEYY